ncbi:MAG: hypothetical protein AB1568_05575 [Thermodesulfobacteriota bacterium]
MRKFYIFERRTATDRRKHPRRRVDGSVNDRRHNCGRPLLIFPEGRSLLRATSFDPADH